MLKFSIREEMWEILSSSSMTGVDDFLRNGKHVEILVSEICNATGRVTRHPRDIYGHQKTYAAKKKEDLVARSFNAGKTSAWRRGVRHELGGTQ